MDTRTEQDLQARVGELERAVEALERNIKPLVEERMAFVQKSAEEQRREAERREVQAKERREWPRGEYSFKDHIPPGTRVRLSDLLPDDPRGHATVLDRASPLAEHVWVVVDKPLDGHDVWCAAKARLAKL